MSKSNESSSSSSELTTESFSDNSTSAAAPTSAGIAAAMATPAKSSMFSVKANDGNGDEDHQLNDQTGETHKRICCVGMCVLDIIHVCANYPIEDTDKRCLDGRMQRGGNASNSCTVLRSLNYEAIEFLGMLSVAKGFEFLRSDCEERKIFYENCPTVEQNPPFSSVILVENTDSRTIVHSNSNFPIFKYEHFVEKMRGKLQNYCWFHFEARNPSETLRMQRDIQAENASSKQQQQPIIISVEFEKLFVENLILALAADFVFLGKELALHMGWHDPKQAAFGLSNWLLEARANVEDWQRQLHGLPKAIICPWGALGVGVLNAQQNVYSFMPAQTPAKIVDALGAGDTFCAATIFGVQALKLSIEAAVEFGNKTAGLKLAQYGYDGLASKINLTNVNN